MSRRPLLLLLAFAMACASLSCGIAGLTPAPVSMPGARAGLQPQYRFFYDALAEDGDWILIEPYGWVFRPHVNFVAWRPYQSGFWAPSDIYGWTWISAESFGWATYHYGQWFYDSFEGWVWVPGLDWGPAWVTWSGDDRYTGWAPQPPPGGGWNGVPGGPYLYVPTSQLTATDLSSHLVRASDLGAEAGRIAPIDNRDEIDGVRFNRGPRFEDVERAAGSPITPVRIAEHAPLAVPTGKLHAAPPGSAPVDSVAVVRRAAAAEARQAREIIDSQSAPPPGLPLLRAPLPQPQRPQAKVPRAAPHAPAAPAASDSAR